MFKRILLVADGSAPAIHAGHMALRLADNCGAQLTGVYVIDAGWRNMLGDEWISSEGLRRRFFEYMERGLAERGSRELADLSKKGAASGLQVETMIRSGKPDRVVEEVFREKGPFDLVVVPHPSGRKEEGAAGINADKISGKISAPVLISPAK